jgi:hypothetical protein
MPKQLRPFSLTLAAVLIAAGVVGGVWVWQALPAHPAGVWGADGEQTFEGVLTTAPYPMVRVPASGGMPARTLVLVDEWKFGLPLGPDWHSGDAVSVQGFAIRRGEVTVFQVDDVLQHRPSAAGPIGPLRDAGVQTLAGEVEDAKCWAGAMNPGQGKVHKGCGSLCLLGAIPPLFVVHRPDGGIDWYVLGAPDGGPLPEEVRARVGEHITLTGHVRAADDLRVFEVAPEAVLRAS